MAWADDVSHRFEQTTPTSPLPLDLRFFVGERYTHDSNIFLSNRPVTSDSILTTFGRIQLQYADPQVDVESDLLADYNSFLQNHAVSADEERFYGRVRYTGSQVSGELGEIFRRESTPLDVVFADRSRRIVSNTLPRVSVDWDKGGTVEAMADIQETQFEQQEFKGVNNLQNRILLMVTRELEGGITVLVDGGFEDIRYSSVSATPDVAGFLGRAGVHGQLSPTVTFDARAGFASVRTQDFPGTNERIKHSTMDAEFHLRTEANDLLAFYGDYVRRITFGIGEPFQTVDLATLTVEFAPDANLKIRARGQFDRAHGATGDIRNYRQVSIGASYTLLATAILDTDVTFRRGRSHQLGGLEDFDDTLVSAGAAITF